MKILIVDDEEICRDKIANLLSPYGECVESASGADALCSFGHAIGQGKPFDLVTLDIDMPDLRGQDVVKAIRQWESRNSFILPCARRVKILMLTVMGDASNIFKAFKQTCDDYVVKPITPVKIRASMAKLGFVGDGQTE